jgi:hypothetical protein
MKDSIHHLLQVLAQVRRFDPIMHLIDVANEGDVFLQAFPECIVLTETTEPPDWFFRVGDSDSYFATVLSLLATERRARTMDGFARLQSFFNEPRSLVEVLEELKQQAGGARSSKPDSLFHELLPWKSLLGEMARARKGPDIERQHHRVLHRFISSPMEMIRIRCCIWAFREYLKALLQGPCTELRKVLVILQGDILLDRDDEQSSRLAKLLINLQKFGWAVIVLSEQLSQLEPILRNACTIPVCLQSAQRDAREQAKHLNSEDDALVPRLLNLSGHHAILAVPGISHPAEVQFEAFRIERTLTRDWLERQIQERQNWVREHTEFSPEPRAATPAAPTAASPAADRSARLIGEHLALLQLIEAHPGIAVTQAYEQLRWKNTDKANRIKQELVEQGLVEQALGTPGPKGGAKPKHLTLTEKGRSLLDARR